MTWIFPAGGSAFAQMVVRGSLRAGGQFNVGHFEKIVACRLGTEKDPAGDAAEAFLFCTGQFLELGFLFKLHFSLPWDIGPT